MLADILVNSENWIKKLSNFLHPDCQIVANAIFKLVLFWYNISVTVIELFWLCYQQHNINFFYNPITPKKAADEFFSPVAFS